MDIRAMIMTAFTSAVILGGCMPPALPPVFLPTPGPTPTPVPIATWVAQSIPNDLSITYSTSGGYKLGDRVIRIAADGSASDTHYPAYGEPLKQFAGKLSPDTLRSVALAFEMKKFFYLKVTDDGCIIDTTNPPTAAIPVHVVDAGKSTVSIHINGISTVLSSGGCELTSARSGKPTNVGEDNFSALVGILADAVKDLPPVAPTAAATGEPISTATPTEP